MAIFNCYVSSPEGILLITWCLLGFFLLVHVRPTNGWQAYKLATVGPGHLLVRVPNRKGFTAWWFPNMAGLWLPFHICDGIILSIDALIFFKMVRKPPTSLLYNTVYQVFSPSATVYGFVCSWISRNSFREDFAGSPSPHFDEKNAWFLDVSRRFSLEYPNIRRYEEGWLPVSVWILARFQDTEMARSEVYADYVHPLLSSHWFHWFAFILLFRSWAKFQMSGLLRV